MGEKGYFTTTAPPIVSKDDTEVVIERLRAQIDPVEDPKWMIALRQMRDILTDPALSVHERRRIVGNLASEFGLPRVFMA